MHHLINVWGDDLIKVFEFAQLKKRRPILDEIITPKGAKQKCQVQTELFLLWTERESSKAVFGLSPAYSDTFWFGSEFPFSALSFISCTNQCSNFRTFLWFKLWKAFGAYPGIYISLWYTMLCMWRFLTTSTLFHSLELDITGFNRAMNDRIMSG